MPSKCGECKTSSGVHADWCSQHPRKMQTHKYRGVDVAYPGNEQEFQVALGDNCLGNPDSPYQATLKQVLDYEIQHHRPFNVFIIALWIGAVVVALVVSVGIFVLFAKFLP